MRKGVKRNSRLARKIKSEWCRQNRAAIIAGAAIMLLAFVIIRLVSGNPYVAMRLLSVRSFLPPMWLFTVAFALLFALAGGACGAVLGCPCSRDAEKYRGGMFFVLMAVFSLLWYPLIFVGFAVFTAILVLAIAVFFGAMCAINFCRVKRGAAALIFLFLIWLAYLLLSNLSLFFSI